MRQLIETDEERALWFRARRGHLAGPGAENPLDAARAVIGLQAQQESPALLGLSLRTAGRPAASELITALREEPRTLVRTWGQRDTLHVFDVGDWADITAARAEWAPGSRRGGMPPEDVLDACWAAVRAKTEPITKDDVYPHLTEAYLADLAEKAASIDMDPARLGGTRVLWKLALRGDLCIAGKAGTERTFANRAAWFPDLTWQPTDPLEAAARLARRYLATYAPATPADIASFFGARVTEVRGWLARIEDELADVLCGDRKGLLALIDDADALREEPGDWPVRMLPLWDGLMMGHKDKSWLVPEKPESKKVWRPGAFVAATVLARGRIVATWKHTSRKKGLKVALRPLSRWQDSYLAALEAEARAIAHHLDLPTAEVDIER